MEILEAYDLTGSYRRAAELSGCDHHTVRRYVQLRGHGVDPTEPAARTKLIDGFLPKVEELVERSLGKIGADEVGAVLNTPLTCTVVVMLVHTSMALWIGCSVARFGNAVRPGNGMRQGSWSCHVDLIIASLWP